MADVGDGLYNVVELLSETGCECAICCLRTEFSNFDSNFNSATQSFTLMITNSFLNCSVPTTAPRCLLPSLFIFKFVSLNIRFAVSYFSGFTVSHDLLAFGKYPILDQKYLVYSSKLVYSLVFLHSLYRLHIQHTLCYLLLLYLIAEEVPEHK